MTFFGAYLDEIKKNLAHGDATEHTHRPALKKLLESIGRGIVATNEPTRILCGAPDFILTKGKIPLGHVETKDVGENLAAMEKGKPPSGEQFGRYLDGLPNWILTDYLEFRWYVNGEHRMTVRLAELDGKKKLQPLPDGEKELANLLKAFLTQKSKTIGTAKDLAERMAGMTRIIRDQIINGLKFEPEPGSLHGWLAAFRESLIPDLDEHKFADMFAQTLAYGLFAARIHAPANQEFNRENAPFCLPATNPFLQQFFYQACGMNLHTSVAWAVDDIVELLNHTDMAAVLKDFGKGKGKDDPIVHFYETFLSAYDPKMREVRGVYYTPDSVVDFIVRGVDSLLQKHFDIKPGIAEPSVLVLDIATGTGTFLHKVIEQVYQKYPLSKFTWNSHVSEKLLKRIFGFEILMAPYAIAHLNLAHLLKQQGALLGDGQRLGIYLTNTLEIAARKSELLLAQFVSKEANEAAEVKSDKPIMVVIGNPPYANFGMMNKGEWILQLLEDYKTDLNETKLNLDDDFIKFIRFAQWRIDTNKEGIVGLVTNNTYLDGLTHRRMRECLMESFTDIYVLNLHGSSKKKEVCPDGTKDENVFDITVGVSITLFVKEPGKTNCRVHYADLWGQRESKYEALGKMSVDTIRWKTLTPNAPHFFFVPRDLKSSREYENGWSVRDMFGVSGNGVKTERDRVTIQFDRKEIETVVNNFRVLDETTLRFKYDQQEDSRDWKVASAKLDVQQNKSKELFRRILYRPFDVRHTWFSGVSKGFIGTPAAKLMHNMLAGDNLAMLACRQQAITGFQHILCSRGLIECAAVSLRTREITSVFPLYIYDDPEAENKKRGGGTMLMALFESSPGYSVRRANLNPKFIQDFTQRLGLKWLPVDSGDLKKTVGPEDFFNYAYAVFHSPTYRERYAEFLKIDFPRLPLTGDLKLFRALAAKGAELVALHLMESPKLDNFITEFNVKGSNEVEKVQYTDNDQRVWINPKQFFAGVPKAVWKFHVGGYQVCEKWLKDRKDRKLTYEDIQHYQKTVVALSETIRLMTEIDKAIPDWPIT
ncbi:MAG TPA: type ISP restriction/modification enzyme [Verrucomicrobiae bacterium]